MKTTLIDLQLARYFPNFNYEKDYVSAVKGSEFVEVEHRARSQDDAYFLDSRNLVSFAQASRTEATHSRLQNILYHPLRTNQRRLVLIGCEQYWTSTELYHHILDLICTMLMEHVQTRSFSEERFKHHRLMDIVGGYRNCIAITDCEGVGHGMRRAAAISDWLERYWRYDGKSNVTLVVDVPNRTVKFLDF